MAVIAGFKRAEKTPKLQPSQVICYWSVADIDGKKLMQIDTYGSKLRQIPGKQSQTLQLDRSQAERLHQILKQQFGFA